MSLIFAVCAGLGVVIIAVGGANAIAQGLAGGEMSEAAIGATLGGMAAGGILVAFSGVLAIIATILLIVGCVQCGKDEESFKAAIIALVITLVLSIIASFFSSNVVLATIADVVNKVVSIFITVMIINGFSVLADKLNNSEVRERGNSILKFIIVLLVLQIILSIIVRLVPSVAGTVIAGVLGVVIVILSIIQYFLFLSFLAKSRNMLNA